MKDNSICDLALEDPLSPNGPRIHRRPNTKNFMVSFSIKGVGQIRKSLGVADVTTAKRLALDLWYDHLRDARDGKILSRKTFADVAESYLAELEHDASRNPATERILRDRVLLANRYFIPFFGCMRIGAINQKTLSEYIKWRENYWFNPDSQKLINTLPLPSSVQYRKKNPKVPKPTSIRREHVQLRHFFKHAKSRGYISTIPECELPSARLNPRPGLTREEAARLCSAAHLRCFEDGVHPRVLYDRIKLRSFVFIALQSGMRVTEMKNLRWKDIDIRCTAAPEVTIHAQGKGKSRDFVVSPDVIPEFDILKALFADEVGRLPSLDDPVFASKQGDPISSFRKGLDALLRATDLLHDKSGKKRSASSFRHYYITEMKRHGVETDILALNAGTSPAMIQLNYSKMKPIEERSRLALNLLK